MKKTKTETKTEKANTPAELIASGGLIVLGEVMSKKAGLVVKVAMPKKDYLAFERGAKLPAHNVDPLLR